MTEVAVIVVAVPVGQFWHVDSSDAPTAKEYVPAEQGTQAETSDWPVSVLYNPAEQESHAPLIKFLYVPALHCGPQ